MVLAADSLSGLWYEKGGPKLPSFAIVLVLQAISLGLFLLNTRDYPAKRSWHGLVLAVQWLLAIPLNSDLLILNAITIPLLCPPRQRLGWLVAHIAGVPFSLAFLLWRQWDELVKVANRENLWTQLYVQVGIGTLGMAAWIVMAYLAALVIAQMEVDRRRLIAINAELLSSRAMLTEASRAAERADMSRELHDSLGHHLTTLNLELELAQRVPGGEKDGHVRQAQLLARLLLADLRETVSAWRKGAASAGLPEALSSLASGINGVKVQLEVDPDLHPLPAPRAHALLRCAQEAVTNALRHSAASSIRMALRNEGEDILLEVRDNGHGCAPLLPGNGLTGIAERAAEFGGKARFESLPQGGFCVEVRVPAAGAEAAA